MSREEGEGGSEVAGTGRDMSYLFFLRRMYNLLHPFLCLHEFFFVCWWRLVVD